MYFIALVLYIAACAVCGIMGRNTAFGFVGHFFVALLLTPIVDFIIQLLGRPSALIREKLRALGPR
jgi:hypothetical protein